MAKMEMKDKKTVRIAEKPLLPPPWGGCGVTGLGWFVSILAAGYWQLACVSQLQVCRGECQRNFFFFLRKNAKGTWCFYSFYFRVMHNKEYIYIYIYWEGKCTGNLHVDSWHVRKSTNTRFLRHHDYLIFLCMHASHMCVRN